MNVKDLKSWFKNIFTETLWALVSRSDMYKYFMVLLLSEAATGGIL